MKWNKQLVVSGVVGFALLTGILNIYAFFHRNKGEGDFVYILFNSYALIALILGVCMVMRRQRQEKHKMDIARKRLTYLTKNLTAPAMLWNDSFTEVIFNDALSKLTDITMSDDMGPKQIVPIFFGKEDMTDEDIREIVIARNQEYSFIDSNGVPHDMIWNTSAVETNGDGVTWLLSIGTDLADIRNMQSKIATYSKQLSVSEGRHNLTMELMDVGLLLIEQNNPQLFLSEKLQKMFGLSSSTVTIDELREMIYPLDVDVFEHHVDMMRRYMAYYVDRTETLELRIRSADGIYRWYAYRFRATMQNESERLAVGGTVIDISAEKEKDEIIEKAAYEDTIVGIPNRNKLMNVGEELYRRTLALNNSYWVIVMDIDRFHLINDTCGYAAGNSLLRSFANILIREMTHDGFGARISGDNFALILPDTGDEGLPERIVSKIQRVLLTKAVGNLSHRTLTCSAGYARMPEDGDSFEHVMDHAEFAISSNKKTHGSITRYTSKMHDAIILENNIETQLHEAILRNELELRYQPKVSLTTGEMIGLEALIRWRSASGELVSPGVFIPIAERSPLITRITHFVMDEACRQMQLWRTMGLPETVISINFSSTDFYQEDVCAQILNTLKKYKLKPQNLEIELTESLACKDIDVATLRMQELRDAGIQLAMDDFGTGYSSLSYLQSLPFTVLKLDRSFIVTMHEKTVVQEIIRSAARIAKAKHIRTLAEGVETQEQADMLSEVGCDYAQGYLYGHPMTAKEAEHFIRTHTIRKIV